MLIFLTYTIVTRMVKLFNCIPLNPNSKHALHTNFFFLKPTATDSLLQLNIDFACSKVNCSAIEPCGECQFPDTIMKHSSVAMNLYYQSYGRTDLNCYFQSTGMVVIEDPSMFAFWHLIIEFPYAIGTYL